jgi:hypothetical protein
MQRRMREDPERFAEDLVRAMIAFDSRYLVRTQSAVAHWLREWDKMSSGPPAFPPNELVELTDRLVRIERHLVGLIQVYAKTRHVMRMEGPKKKAARVPARCPLKGSVSRKRNPASPPKSLRKSSATHRKEATNGPAVTECPAPAA